MKDCKIRSTEADKIQNVYKINGEDVDFSAVNKTAWDYKSYEFWQLKYGPPQKFGRKIAEKPDFLLEKYSDFFESLENKSLININGKKYRGNVEIRRFSDSDMTVINHLSMQEYLYGVVPKEMSTGHPLEALKAQAVIARTYTLNKIETKKHSTTF